MFTKEHYMYDVCTVFKMPKVFGVSHVSTSVAGIQGRGPTRRCSQHRVQHPVLPSSPWQRSALLTGRFLGLVCGGTCSFLDGLWYSCLGGGRTGVKRRTFKVVLLRRKDSWVETWRHTWRIIVFGLTEPEKCDQVGATLPVEQPEKQGCCGGRAVMTWGSAAVGVGQLARSLGLKHFILWTPFSSWLLRPSEGFCLCNMVFTALEIKTEKLKKYFLIHLKINLLHVHIVVFRKVTFPKQKKNLWEKSYYFTCLANLSNSCHTSL